MQRIESKSENKHMAAYSSWDTHQGRANSVVPLANSQAAIVSLINNRNIIHIWNLETKTSFDLDQKVSCDAMIEIFGTHLATYSHSDHNIRIWDIAKKECILTQRCELHVLSIAVSSEGNLITRHRNKLQIWKIDNGKLTLLSAINASGCDYRNNMITLVNKSFAIDFEEDLGCFRSWNFKNGNYKKFPFAASDLSLYPLNQSKTGDFVSLTRCGNNDAVVVWKVDENGIINRVGLLSRFGSHCGVALYAPAVELLDEEHLVVSGGGGEMSLWNVPRQQFITSINLKEKDSGIEYFIPCSNGKIGYVTYEGNLGILEFNCVKDYIQKKVATISTSTPLIPELNNIIFGYMGYSENYSSLFKAAKAYTKEEIAFIDASCAINTP